MKRIALVTAALLALSLNIAQAQIPAPAAAAAAAQTPAITAKLTRNQLDGLLTYPDQVLLIDVRRPDEITTIGGFATYLSIQSADLEKSLAFIPRDRTIITVSNHAGRALKAADLLLSKGFKIGGAVGVQDYEKEGGKLVKISAPAPKVAAAN